MLYLLLVVLTLFSLSIQGQSVIIFDLGGVVFKEPEHCIFDNLPKEIRSQFPVGFSPMRVFLRAFDFVNLVEQKDLKTPWLFGEISGTEIAQSIHRHIDNPEHATFFAHEYERLLIKHGALMMFDPESLAEWTYLYPEALDFISACKKQGTRLVILSNWDPLSFAFLKKKYPELFSHFAENDIFIPATIGYAKPDKKVYQCILHKLQVIPEKCSFIDDSRKNIEAAQECGIKGIVHTDWTTTQLVLGMS